MAIKVFNANLNGGDAVTPNDELIYRIYGSADNFLTPIATAGSDITDVNVTVTGDVVVIENVNVGSEKTFKIASVDANGNESELSNEYGSFLFNDEFTGVVINTNKWNLANPDPSQVHISQNNELVWTADGTSDTTPYANTLRTVEGWDINNEIKTFSFDIISALQNNARWVVALSKDVALVSDLSRIGLQGNSTPTTITLMIKEAGSVTYSFGSNLDISTVQSFKIVISNGWIEFYIWVAGFWTKKGVTTVFTSTGIHYLNLAKDDQTAKANVVTIDNVYVTDADFVTQYPTVLDFVPLEFTLSDFIEEAISSFHAGLVGNWGAYAVSTVAISGDFEISLSTFQVSLNDCMIGISDHGVNAGFSDGTNFWDAIIYNNNTAPFVGREANSAIVIDNPTSNNFNPGDLMVLKRVGSVLTFIYREVGGDTLVHTFANSYSNDLYMHFSCYQNQFVFNPMRLT